MGKGGGLSESLVHSRDAVENTNEASEEEIAAESSLSPHLSSQPENGSVLGEHDLADGGIAYNINGFRV